jgi:tRNA G10  N-methylase Trm11
MTTDPGDLVLDPTRGSGTTAYVAEQWGRRWITCDTSRVALALARTRLMAAKFPYYLLAEFAAKVEKALAALRNNIKNVIIPYLNKKDLIELPLYLRKKINFSPVKHMDEVLRIALANRKS